MPEMHLRQPGFIYSACGPFRKFTDRIKKKTKKNSRFTIYLSKWIRSSLFSTWDGLWVF